MDSAHIVLHKWPLYFIYCILLIFHNKEFTQVHILLDHTIPYQWSLYTTCYILFLLHNKKTKPPALPQGPTSPHYFHNSLHHNPLWPNTLAPNILTSYSICVICYMLLVPYNNPYTSLQSYQGCLSILCIISYLLHNHYNATTPTQYSTLSERTCTNSPPSQKNLITKRTSYLTPSIYFNSHNHLRRSTTTKLILLLGLSYLYANKQSNSTTYITNSTPQRDHTTNIVLLTHQMYTHPKYKTTASQSHPSATRNINIQNFTTQTHFTYYHTNLPYVHNHHATALHQKPPPTIHTLNSLDNQSTYTILLHKPTSHTPILQYSSNIQIFPVHTPINHAYTHPPILHSSTHHAPQPQNLPKYETNHDKSTKSTYPIYERSHNIFNPCVTPTNNIQILHTNTLPSINKIYYVISLLTPPTITYRLHLQPFLSTSSKATASIYFSSKAKPPFDTWNTFKTYAIPYK